jgi:hypothetical protein
MGDVSGEEGEESMTKTDISERQQELEFRRGYYCAVANLVRLHGADVEARDTLFNYGKFDERGIDESDLQILRPLAKEIKRLQTITFRKD